MTKVQSQAKDIFKLIIILLVTILIILPFATSFNEFLTRVVEDSKLYRPIQTVFVPYVSNILAGILNLLPGLDIKTFPFGIIVNGVDVRVTWNCLGWQSFILFFVSLIWGLKGNYSLYSKFQVFIFGFLGTFIINIFRLVFTAALVGWWRGLFVILFHNYFMTFVSIIWLFFFWWFCYSYVLEEKKIKVLN